MRSADFFIVGAPKCGTTSLAAYLSYRDDVFMASPKEPHFFATDFPQYREVDSLEDYCALFDDAKEHQLIGEASVFYLYSSVALSRIRNYNENAKIIVMLRDPVSLLHSLHSQLLFTFDEDVADFSRAWALTASRRKNINVPTQCRESSILLYDRIAGFEAQLQKLYALFPPENVCVVLFDDFVDNTAEVFKSVCGFLGLSDLENGYYPAINENRIHRYPKVSKFINEMTRRVSRPVKFFKRILRIDEIGILKKLRQMGTKYEKRQPLAFSVRSQISKNYEADIAYVEKLLDRDLSGWRSF